MTKKPIYRIAGVPVYLHFSWFIAVGFFTWLLATSHFPKVLPLGLTEKHWLLGLITTLLIFASVFLHELGHTMYSKRKKVNVKSIKLHVFGGVAQIDGEMKSPKDEFFMAIAGPSTSFLLAAGFYVIGGTIADYLFKVNLIIGIFNLLPALPLDGGRILKAFLWHRNGNYVRATEIACKAGIWFSTINMAFGILFIFTKALSAGLWFLFLGGYLRLVAEAYYQNVKGTSSLSNVKVSDIMIPWKNVVTVNQETPVGEFLKKYFLIYGFSSFPVLSSDGKAIGMLSSFNIQNKTQGAGGLKHNDPVAMALEPCLEISYKSTAAVALEMILLNQTITHGGSLVVVDSKSPVGLITKTSLLRAAKLYNGGGIGV